MSTATKTTPPSSSSSDPNDKAFLQETSYTNYSHPLVQRVIAQCVADVKKDASACDHHPTNSFKEDHQVRLARRLFYYTRDSVRWRMGIWHQSASDTICHGYGSCTNKANLFVALLRGCGIPAGFHVMSVHHKYLGDQVPEYWNNVRKKMDAKTRHFYTAIFLNGKWLRVDATDDIGIWRCMGHLVQEAALVNFNGYEDAMLSLKPHYVFSDDGPLPSIENHLLRKKTNVAEAWIAGMLDPVDQFTREKGASFSTIEAYQQGLIAFMWKNHSFKMAVFSFVIWHRVETRKNGLGINVWLLPVLFVLLAFIARCFGLV